MMHAGVFMPRSTLGFHRYLPLFLSKHRPGFSSGGKSAETQGLHVWTDPCYCSARTMEHMLQT